MVLAFAIATTAAFAGGSALLEQGLLPPVPALLEGNRSNPQTSLTDNDRVALYLVRSTLMTLDDANRTGNYSVLRQLASPSFQQANSAGQLADAFAAQRARLDLSVAALAQPHWDQPPAIGPDRLLRLVGDYIVETERLRFALAFEATAGAWRLFEIHVGLEAAAPQRLQAAGLR